MAVSHILWFWILTALHGGVCEPGKYTTGWQKKSGAEASTNHLNGVLFANDQFLAFGRRTIELSTDGDSWSVKKDGGNFGGRYYGAAFAVVGGNKKYVVVGGDGSAAPYQIQESLDGGVTWENIYINQAWGAFAVAFGGGTFITGGVSVSYKSDTGESDDWVQVNGPSGGNWNIYDIIYTSNNGRFVGCGNGIYTSNNGGAWELKYPLEGGSIRLNALAYGNGKYVAVGEGGTVLTSADSDEWTAQTIEGSGNLWGVAFGLNKFIAVDNNGNMYGSFGGINWEKQTNDVAEGIVLGLGGDSNDVSNHLAFGKGKFVVVGSKEFIFVAEDSACIEDVCTTTECSSCPAATSCATKGASCTWDGDSCETPSSDGSGGFISPRPWAWLLMICLSIIIIH